MAQYRKSKAMREQVRELSKQGFGIKKIARALNISKNTVRSILRETTQNLADSTDPSWNQGICWDLIEKEYRKGVTVKILHQENAPHISYWTFRRYLRSRCPLAKEITMRLVHNPGEKTFIDFADGIDMICPRTGEVTKTQFFCGVLPFSSYTFGEFVLNQKLDTFISVQERMFRYFGGVTPYVTPDNLKSAVTKAHLYDPDENKTYCEFGNHYGFAVLPARPRKPKDKGAVENAIGVIQRQFYNEVRNQKFYSLEELNKAFRSYLTRLNQSVMKDYGVSRSERFIEEKKFLNSLPLSAYELSEWRESKVHPDCEIQVEKSFYTVPFTYVGKSVRVRIRSSTIDVFDKETAQQITMHVRLKSLGKHSRYDWHYPPEKIQLARYEVQTAKFNASNIGPHTEKLVEKLFEGQWPLRGLRRAQGVLRLSSKHTREAMEYACSATLRFNKINFEYVKQCACHFEKKDFLEPIFSAPRRDLGTVYLHSSFERN